MAVITSAITATAVALGASATTAGTIGAIGAGLAYAGAATAGGIMAKQSSTDSRKASANASRDAQAQAAQIEAKSKEAEAIAEQKARDEARKKLSQQTQTIFTSGLGLLGTDTQTKKATLGSN